MRTAASKPEREGPLRQAGHAGTVEPQLKQEA
jgi:hypothetical protein